MAKDYTKGKNYTGTYDGKDKSDDGMIPSGMNAGKHYDDLDDGEKADLASSDADTMTRHAEIKQHPPRLQAATQHLQSRKSAVGAAHANGRRALMQKTGQRLKNVFGDEAGSEDATPFEKAKHAGE